MEERWERKRDRVKEAKRAVRALMEELLPRKTLEEFDDLDWKEHRKALKLEQMLRQLEKM